MTWNGLLTPLATAGVAINKLAEMIPPAHHVSVDDAKLAKPSLR